VAAPQGGLRRGRPTIRGLDSGPLVASICAGQTSSGAPGRIRTIFKAQMTMLVRALKQLLTCTDARIAREPARTKMP
jgi:hypothetical protein